MATPLERPRELMPPIREEAVVEAEEPTEESPEGSGDAVRMPPLPLPPPPPPPAPAEPPPAAEPAPAPALDPPVPAAAEEERAAGGARRRSSSWRTGRKECGAAGCCVNSSAGPGSCLRTSAQLALPHPGLCATWRRRAVRGA